MIWARQLKDESQILIVSSLKRALPHCDDEQIHQQVVDLSFQYAKKEKVCSITLNVTALEQDISIETITTLVSSLSGTFYADLEKTVKELIQVQLGPVAWFLIKTDQFVASRLGRPHFVHCAKLFSIASVGADQVHLADAMRAIGEVCDSMNCLPASLGPTDTLPDGKLGGAADIELGVTGCCQAMDKVKQIFDSDVTLIDPMVIDIVIHLKEKVYPNLRGDVCRLLERPIRSCLQEFVDLALFAARELHKVCQGGVDGQHWSSTKGAGVDILSFAQDTLLKMQASQTQHITTLASKAEEAS